MDDIQRKLALIDKQLAGRHIHKQIVSTCPLLFVAVGLIVGILIQNSLDISIYFWLSLLALFMTAAILLFILKKPYEHNQYISAYFAFICFICLGSIRLANYIQPEANDVRNLAINEPTLATIRGQIVTEPYINKYHDWKFAQFMPTDPTCSFYLKVQEVETVNGWIETTGKVRVQVDEPVLNLSPGDYIQTYCWLDIFRPSTNPGQFNTAGYLARKNVFIGASIKSRDGITVLQSSDYGSFVKLKAKIRQIAETALLGDMPQDESNQGLLQALLLGYRGDIDSDTYQAFRKTGLLHFISLSGMHLGILVGMIWWLCKIAGLMKPARAAVCIVMITLFLLVVPPRAPTLRAAVICFVYCASFFFNRYPNPKNTLSLAAIIILLLSPMQLFEPGWQLSFVTVLGLLLFCERIHFFLYEKIGGIPLSKKVKKTSSFFSLVKKPGPYLLRLFSTGLTAWISGAGILLYHFYTINPMTFFWTVLVFPLVAAILMLGFLKMILFYLLPTMSIFLGFIVTLLSDVLIWIVKIISELDISQILIGHVSFALIIFYYSVILFAAFAAFRRPLIKKAICTVAVFAIVVFLGVVKWQRTYRDNLIMTCLDVGHGQSILVQLPGSSNILFDAGSMYRNDIGRRIVTPFLDYIGTNRLDAVIISHNDVDHINGIPEIAENRKVSNVYANDDFLDKTDQWGTAQFLSDCLKQVDLKIQSLDTVLNFGSQAHLNILWPKKDINYDSELSDNNKSLVSLIEFADVKILLCSDIEEFAQNELLKLYPDLNPDIVIVPHHGSTNTLDNDFLKKLNADILICSCSQSQYERIIRNKDQTISGLDMAKFFYTSKDGAIIISIDKQGKINITTNNK